MTASEKTTRHGRTCGHARRAIAACALGLWAVTSVDAQESARPTVRVSVYADSATRLPVDGAGETTRMFDLWTSATVESPQAGDGSLEYRFDGRHSRSLLDGRPARVSIYDAWVGARVGTTTQVRVRGGHLWLQDLGTVGALAGGLVELGQRASVDRPGTRLGVFAGLEPTMYEVGYAPNVRKIGTYFAFEEAFRRRHIVGYTRVTQGALVERSVLSVTNLVPAGSNVFAYQVAEYDVGGPAGGAVPAGLSYFLTNLRVNAGDRVELTGTYNRGRSIDARRLTTDLLHDRALTPQAVEGLRYESRGGRLSIEVVRGLRLSGAYAQDRNNRGDDLTGRVTLGMHASNVARSGLDVSASNSRVAGTTGAYHSTFFSVGHSLGRALYVSGDYATSLSVVQLLRGDGLLIETRPWTRRVSGSANANMNREVSLSVTAEVTDDEFQRDVRVLSGLSFRLR